jgi:hypothetical protein
MQKEQEGYGVGIIREREWEKDAKGRKKSGTLAERGQVMGRRKEKRRAEGIKRREMQAKTTKKGRKV